MQRVPVAVAFAFAVVAGLGCSRGVLDTGAVARTDAGSPGSQAAAGARGAGTAPARSTSGDAGVAPSGTRPATDAGRRDLDAGSATAPPAVKRVDASVAPSSDDDAGGADCDTAAVDAVAAVLAQHAGECTVVVLVDFFTGEITGWGTRCGAEAPVDEATALQAVSEGSSLTAWDVLSAASAQDGYVFYELPGDLGQVVVVSPRTGVVTFRGGIVWSGTGTLTTPSVFRDGAELKGTCPVPAAPASSFYDLSFGDAFYAPWPIDAPYQPPSGLAAVEHSVLPAAIARERTWLDSLELIYPRTVGGFQPDAASIVVLLNVSAPQSASNAL